MNVLITGAARGIGLALARHYAGGGDEVLATARDPKGAPAIERVDWQRLDVTEPADFNALAARLGDEPLDLLICNAGIFPDRGFGLDGAYDAGLWADTLATNVTGAFLAVEAFLPALRRGREANIAFIASDYASSTLAEGGGFAYRASKAALVNLAANLAHALRGEGVSIGAYHPGWVATDMGGEGAPVSPEASAAGLARRISALSLETSGCFEDHEGRALPY